MALLLAALLAASPLEPDLGRGPVVQVEEKQGAFHSATAFVRIDAPPDVVWEVLLHPERFSAFMPRMALSEIVTRRGAADADVRMVIEAPGPDTDYTGRWQWDVSTRSIRIAQSAGDLSGSRWTWTVAARADGAGSVIAHRVEVRNFSSFVASVEDDQRTVSLGVNVGAALAAVRGVKERAERLAAEARAARPQ